MPSTSDNIYTQQWSNMLDVQFQQKESRLLKTVTIDKMAAQAMFFDRLNATSAPAARSARGTPIVPVDPTFSRRGVIPVTYEQDAIVDSIDKMRTNIDPTSHLYNNQIMAHNRNFDDVIISAATGTALSYTINGAAPTSVSPLSANTVAVNYDEPGTSQSGNTGLTVGKLKQARQILFALEAVTPEEELYVIANTNQINQLLRDPQVTNIFYNDAKPLINGEIESRFLGFNFIRSERIPNSSKIVTGAPYPTAMVYPQSALNFAWLEPLHGKVVPADWLQGDCWLIKSMTSFAAVRMWEEKVVQILTDPTA